MRIQTGCGSVSSTSPKDGASGPSSCCSCAQLMASANARDAPYTAGFFSPNVALLDRSQTSLKASLAVVQRLTGALTLGPKLTE